MTEEGPWQRYDRDKLPTGWAYPLGRDEVTAALVAAGVSLGSLSFSRTDRIRSGGPYVLHAYRPSDSRAKYFGTRDSDFSPLMMSIGAVPSELRYDLGQQLRDVWLERVVAWAQRAPTSSNPWTATNHYWILIRKPDGRLALEAT